MGIIDIAIIAIFALFLLSGFYKGFIWNLSALAATVIAILLAHLLMGRLSALIVKNDTLYDAMLSYTEGAEAIKDVELRDDEITSLTNDQIDEVMELSGLPFPLRDRVYENIMDEAFKDKGITTLGDYFNESIVHSIINIVSFMCIYFAARIILTFLICWLDYSLRFPRLRIGDSVVGSALGLVRGFVDVLVVFMAVPILLTVLPFDSIETMISESAMASFLHTSNFFLKFIPGVV